MNKNNIINKLLQENDLLKEQKAELIEIIEDRATHLIRGVSSLLFGLMQQGDKLSPKELEYSHCLLNEQLNSIANELEKTVQKNR